MTFNQAQAQFPEAYYQRMKDSLDRVNYDKGDLYQLVQNTHLAFKTYYVGRGTIFQQEEAVMPCVMVYDKENTRIFIGNKKELKYIPVDVVQTIEVTHDRDTNRYGMSRMICFVRIMLKDNWEKAYKAAKAAAEEKP